MRNEFTAGSNVKRPLSPGRAARKGRDYYATVLAEGIVAAGPAQHPLDHEVAFYRLKLWLNFEQKPDDLSFYLENLKPLLGAIERRTRVIKALQDLARRLERHSQRSGAARPLQLPPPLLAVLRPEVDPMSTRKAA